MYFCPFRPLPPPVAWAQRKNLIFLTICLEDCRNPVIKLEENKIFFKGTGGTEKKDYEYTYELFKEIDTEVSTHVKSIQFSYSLGIICSNGAVVSVLTMNLCGRVQVLAEAVGMQFTLQFILQTFSNFGICRQSFN